jgi:hypothetical protein
MSLPVPAPHLAREPTPNSPHSSVAPAMGRGTPLMLGGVPYTVSRYWASLRESAEFPTDVKGVVTLLVNSAVTFPGLYSPSHNVLLWW